MDRNVSRSSLARANKDSDYFIFEEYVYHLANEARKRRVIDVFKLVGKVYAFDSITIDMCLAVCWWSKFYRTKGGIKVQMLYQGVTYYDQK